MGRNSNFIFINYEEFTGDNYKGVEAWKATANGSTRKKLFYTGDVVKDFADARDYLRKNGLRTIASSSVDNFIMDSKEDYDFDTETFSIVRAK